MSWDGNRWVADGPPDGQHRIAVRPSRHRRRWIAALGVMILAPALLIPFWPVNAAGPRLMFFGNPIPGASLRVSGDGFNAQLWVALRWDGSGIGMPSVPTSAKGTFETNLVIPANAVRGVHTLRADALYLRGRKSGASAELVSATITVVDPPIPPDQTATATANGARRTDAPGTAAPGTDGAPTAMPGAPTGAGGPTSGPKPTETATATHVAAPRPTAAATHVATPRPTAAATAVPTATVKPIALPSAPSSTDAPTATPTTVLTPTGIVYGPAIAIDTKDNLPVGGPGLGKVAHRFRASTSSALTAIRWAQRGGSGGYAAGDGGSYLISVEADVNGQPSGTPLASLTYTAGWPGGAWAPFNQQTFASPATLTAGNLYDIVFENVAADPVGNFISVNEVFIYNYTYSPRQVALSNDYAILYSQNGGTYGVRPRDTADMDLTYANGHHDGMAYIEAMAAQAAYVSGGATMAREHFTVSGGDKVVASATVRVMRLSGPASNPLTVTLETGSGEAIESVDVPASSIPVSTVGDTSGGTWVTATFGTPHMLTSGQTYNLRLSTGSGITYVAIPIREGTDSGFNSYRFTDGDGQKTTNGSSWANCYAYSPVDLQFYFH